MIFNNVEVDVIRLLISSIVLFPYFVSPSGDLRFTVDIVASAST